jgi:hypothetical protein
MKGTEAVGGGGRHLRGKDVKKKFLKRKNGEIKFFQGGSAKGRLIAACFQDQFSVGL